MGYWIIPEHVYLRNISKDLIQRLYSFYLDGLLFCGN